MPTSPVFWGKDYRLAYIPDSLGNRILDFSHSGYMGGNARIPDVPVKVIVPVQPGDATLRIQSALDYVASLPLGTADFRGAVLLEKGTHTINGSLLIKNSGVVLRGSGAGEGGTLLKGEGKTRETIVRIRGRGDRKTEREIRITDAYVPVNATTFNVENSGAMKKGDRICIRRPSTKTWIQTLKMEEFGGETGWLGWKSGQRDVVWERTITSVSDNRVTVDAPITTALDQQFGGGNISVYQWPGRISQVGVENLRIESAFDKSNPKDEDHRWMGITWENVENGWVRQVDFRNLAGSAVAVYETASKVTVEDCKSLNPVSEIGGQRRYTFFTQGQQTLFQRCYAENGYHDFATGFCAAGPNAFVQCESYQPFSFSGAIDSWASGVLFDIVHVDGNALRFRNRGQDGQGAGWTAANSVFWQCAAARVDNFSPPTATNYAFGIWAQFAGDGYWENSNEHIQPRSLYYAQLSERLGKEVLERAFILPTETEATSSPTIEQAEKLAAVSKEPAYQLTDWIDKVREKNPVLTAHAAVRSIDEIGINKIVSDKPGPSYSITNGWLVRDQQVVTGRSQEVSWWRGSTKPHDISTAKPHITRFVPGRYGKGLTDDLEEMTDFLTANQITVLDHNYGLWYDRRRDDHERVRRMDGEVWAPFYEQPFARSGKERAWDNLSKYDLTKYNSFYWDRLRQFAEMADRKGLMLYHQHYFQHNILEAGAHYADSPWRPANNINVTGFPEPPPYAGDKRIFMADQFYDVSHSVRRSLHKAYIRKCLDNFAANGSVVHFLSAEYTGPLHFVKFWLDVISEWEKENGKNAMVALSTTKDVQDAILSDPDYAALVDIIDIRYWHKKEDGTYYAPEGGKNLAPRQHARIQKPGKVSFASVYQAVVEYRSKFPEKAVIYSGSGYEVHAWAVFMAGGSVGAVPGVSNSKLLSEAATMKPVIHNNEPYVLANADKGMVIYRATGRLDSLDLRSLSGSYILRKVNAKTGEISGRVEKVNGGKVLSIKSADTGPVLVWLSKK